MFKAWYVRIKKLAKDSLGDRQPVEINENGGDVIIFVASRD